PICIWNVKLRIDNPIERRDAVLRFIQVAYSNTDRWTKKLLVAGVDYVNFRSFFVIFYSACGTSSISEKELESIFGRKDYEVSVVKTSSLTDSAAVRRAYPSSLKLFLHYRGRSKVQECLIKLSA